MREVGHVACMDDIWSVNLERRELLEELGVARRIILILILKE
jgi:hypothetical protein